jgi:hypothetical protein
VAERPSLVIRANSQAPDFSSVSVIRSSISTLSRERCSASCEPAVGRGPDEGTALLDADRADGVPERCAGEVHVRPLPKQRRTGRVAAVAELDRAAHLEVDLLAQVGGGCGRERAPGPVPSARDLLAGTGRRRGADHRRQGEAVRPLQHGGEVVVGGVGPRSAPPVGEHRVAGDRREHGPDLVRHVGRDRGPAAVGVPAQEPHVADRVRAVHVVRPVGGGVEQLVAE